MFPLLMLPDPIGIKVVSFLNVHSYLSFRRVSSKTKMWVDCLATSKEDQINMNFDWSENLRVKIYEETNEDGPSFLDYNNSKLMISNFWFKNGMDNSHKMFESSDASIFLDRQANRIRFVTVNGFNACVEDVEFFLYQRLKNLKGLEIGVLSVDHNKTPKLSTSFKGLRELKVHNVATANGGKFVYLWVLFQFSSFVRKIHHPRIMNDMAFYPEPCQTRGFLGHISKVISHRTNLQNQFPQRGLSILELDIKEMPFTPEFVTPMNFRQLVIACVRPGIQLHNVDPRLLMFDEHIWVDYKRTIFSLSGLIFSWLIFELPLTKLNLRLSSCDPPSRDTAIVWPLLQEIQMTFDIENADKAKRTNQLLFNGGERPALENLKIEFLANFRNSICSPKYFQAALVAKCAINLKRLTLSNWDGRNVSFLKLFDGLENLEEIEFNKCQTLSNVAFIGEDEGNPKFLKLKKLKKLSLKGLDKMPKITDRCFRDVLQHLQLSHFVMTSDRPLVKVTNEGISSLAIESNSFSKSIEKFSFRGWSLEGESEESFRKLRDMFHCNA